MAAAAFYDLDGTLVSTMERRPDPEASSPPGLPEKAPSSTPREAACVRLPARASILVRIHYKKTWLDERKEVSDRSALALYDAEPDAAPVKSLVVEAGEGNPALTKDGAYEKPVVERIRADVEVLALLPRVETQLDSFVAEAVLPDGTRRSLIRLRQPDAAWPREFWLEEPLSLPGHAHPAHAHLREGSRARGAPLLSHERGHELKTHLSRIAPSMGAPALRLNSW